MREAENLRSGAVLQSFSRVTIPVLSPLVPLSSVHGVAPWQQGGNKTTRPTSHGTGLSSFAPQKYGVERPRHIFRDGPVLILAMETLSTRVLQTALACPC
jgi:hypothetical protein